MGSVAADHRMVDAELMVKVCVIVAVLLILWVLPNWDTYRDRAALVSRALGASDPPPPQPSGPPLEQIAADIRRIRAQINRAPTGMPVARLRGWFGAYDDVLATACHALGLEERISAMPEGVKRDLERERVERLLTRAGLQLRLLD